MEKHEAIRKLAKELPFRGYRVKYGSEYRRLISYGIEFYLDTHQKYEPWMCPSELVGDNTLQQFIKSKGISCVFAEEYLSHIVWVAVDCDAYKDYL